MTWVAKDGADIIDIGAVSTRPGAKEVSQKDEMNRLIWPLQRLAKLFPEALFSVDTWRSEVARESILNGAHIINDISGGNFDGRMFETVAELKAPYILMHIHGSPEDMQSEPLDVNIIATVYEFFKKKVGMLNKLGVDDIILDPGFGFGKTLKCNYTLLKNLEKLRIGDLPVLGGISRKSMINKVINSRPSEALNGTTVLNTIALLNGANLLRVHDVKEAAEALRIFEYYTHFSDCGETRD